MAKTVLYIASSLDGYIARTDGNLDWLTSIPLPEKGDYGYAKLLDSVGTMMMGRKTYDTILGFGVEWPYTDHDTYIVTSDKNLNVKSPRTNILTSDLNDFVTGLKGKSEKDIWLVGGGQLITTFINLGLLDRIILTLIPKIIGEGVPLFAGRSVETSWQLISSQAFDTGVVNLTYEKSN